MSVAALGTFRRLRLQQFRSKCRIERRAEGDFNDATGKVERPAPAIIYQGRCNVREMQWEGTDAVTGEREVRMQRSELFLPPNVSIREGDVLVVTASKHDADLVGQEYRITDIFLDAWQVSRRAIGEKLTERAEG
jgi:hypothetical protein